MLNPLSIITTESELALRKERSVDSLLLSLQEIQHASDRLTSLLSNMLLLARLEESQDGTSASPNNWMAQLDQWRTKAEKQGCTIDFGSFGSESRDGPDSGHSSGS